MTRSISITLFLLLLAAVTVVLAVAAARHGGVLADPDMHFHG